MSRTDDGLRAAVGSGVLYCFLTPTTNRFLPQSSLTFRKCGKLPPLCFLINCFMSLCCVPSTIAMGRSSCFGTQDGLGIKGYCSTCAFKMRIEILTAQLHPVSVQPPHRSRVGVDEFKARLWCTLVVTTISQLLQIINRFWYAGGSCDFYIIQNDL